MIPTAIGVTVYNEEANLDRLLAVVTTARGPHLEVRQIVIVSSGSTDRTVEIAQAWARRDPRVRVRIDPERRGKATAVNQFLAELVPGIEVAILTGGDLLPEEGALDALVAPFHDADVGMTGAHPISANARTTWIDRVVRLQWELHHEVSLSSPKMGEIVAFRADVPQLDPQTVVDEAFLETIARERRQRIVYVPEAHVVNRGPSSLGEFLDQRRRVYCGHLWLKRTEGYEVSTLRAANLLPAALRHGAAHPREVPTLLAAAGVEILGRSLGILDYARGRKPFVWGVIAGSKRPLEAGE